MPIIPKEERPCNDVAERIIGNLGIAAIQRVEEALGLEDELRRILLDAEKKAIKLLGAGDLLEELEDALYQADDLLNDKSSQPEAAGNERTTKLVGLFLCSTSRLKKVGSKIRGIEKELVERRAHEFRSELVSKKGLKDPSYGLLESKDVIGRNGDRKEILKLLLQNDNKMEQGNVVVVPIVGSEGLGKTQLAKLIFNDDVVKEHFKARLWISGFDTLRLDYQLRYNLLPQKIEGKRFLIVVDDLCSNDRIKLSFLRDLLRSGEKGSRVIVTTRTMEIAQSVMAAVKTRHDLDSEGEKRIYHLGCIDENASLALMRKSMRLKEEEPKGLKEMVGKCEGNPLAIRARGHMFYLENLGTEWQKSLDKWDIEKISQERESALGVLKLYYEHLPTFLKPCFAYCGLFPKNYEIDVPTLINLWMSQRFILFSSSTECPEDVGYKYVMELHKRMFFEKVKIDEWGKITRCKMLSLMHELAREVAGIECATLGLEEEENIQSKTRHVSFDFHLDSPWQLTDSLYQGKRIRTIILPSQLQWQIEGRSGKSICDTIVSNLKYLRTLDLHNSGIKVVSDYIGELRHLRYLDLSQNTDIKVLPKSICALSHLQTLKLNYCGRLKELPREIRKVTSLRDLEIDSCYSLTHMPPGIGELTNLQTLSEFVLSSKRSADEQLDELKSLNSLKGELRIKNLKLGMDATRAKLDEKTYLRSLMLIWDIDRSSSDGKEEIKPNSNDLEDEKTTVEELKPNSKDLDNEKTTTKELKPQSNLKDEKKTTEELKLHSNDPSDERTTTKELKPHSKYLKDEKRKTEELKTKSNDVKDENPTTEELKPNSNDLKDEKRKTGELKPKSDDAKDEKTTEELKQNSNDPKKGKTTTEEPKPNSNDVEDEKTTEELKQNSNAPKDGKTTTKELKPKSFDIKHEKMTTVELKPNSNDLNDQKEEIKPHSNDLKEEKMTTKELKPHSNDVKDEKNTTEELKPHSNDLREEKRTKEELKPHSNDVKDEKTTIKGSKPHSDDLRDEKLTTKELNTLSSDVKDEKTTTEELKTNSNDLKDGQPTTEEHKPHSNLKELSLFAYSGFQFPSWLPLHENLVKFSLWKCMKCRSLPPLNGLPRLKVLALEDMTDLEFISEKVSGQKFFPSLKELRLIDLPKLQSWWSYLDKTPKPTKFPSLSELTIEDCPNLTSMPFSEHLQVLVLKNTSWTPFHQIQKTTTDESTISLPQLRSLRLVCVSIIDLNKNWQSLPNLESLTFDHIPYIDTLSEELKHLKKLKELHIWRCNKLNDISKCIVNLESLKTLSLKFCLNLKLPIETISFLAKLPSLEVEDCPKVEYVLNKRFSS